MEKVLKYKEREALNAKEIAQDISVRKDREAREAARVEQVILELKRRENMSEAERHREDEEVAALQRLRKKRIRKEAKARAYNAHALKRDATLTGRWGDVVKHGFLFGAGISVALYLFVFCGQWMQHDSIAFVIGSMLGTFSCSVALCSGIPLIRAVLRPARLLIRVRFLVAVAMLLIGSFMMLPVASIFLAIIADHESLMLSFYQR